MRIAQPLLILTLAFTLIFASCSKKPSKALYAGNGTWTGTIVTLTNASGLVTKDSATGSWVFTKDGKVKVTPNGSTNAETFKWTYDETHEAVDLTLLDANGNAVGSAFPYTVTVTKGNTETWVGFKSTTGVSIKSNVSLKK